jgi:hypothetical protein
MYPDTHNRTQFSLCTVIVFWLRPNSYRDAAPVHFSKPVTGDRNSSLYKVCTAIPPAPNKICAITATTAPYLSCHRDSFLAKAPGPVAGWLRQVTQPPFIAGPLWLIRWLRDS